MDMIEYSLVQSQRATDVVVTECKWGNLVQSQRATDVVVSECEWGKTKHACFCSVFTMCDSTRQNGFVTIR